MATHDVRLTVPAAPDYVRIARLTSSGIASRLGFDYEDVEDLRIAVGEACSLLIGESGVEGDLTLRFHVSEESLAIDVELGRPSTQGADPHAREEDGDGGLSEQILAAVVDRHDVAPDGHHVHLVKSRNRS